MIALAIDADDEHGSPVAIAGWLVGSQDGRVSALGRGVTDTLAETTVAELVAAAEEFDRIVGVVGSERRLHGPIVLVAKGQKVRPHATASLALWRTVAPQSRESLPQFPPQDLSRGRSWDDFHKMNFARLLVMSEPVGHKVPELFV
jgi:hypothetical protein